MSTRDTLLEETDRRRIQFMKEMELAFNQSVTPTYLDEFRPSEKAKEIFHSKPYDIRKVN